MPTYEYECEKCGFRFEEFQKITDDPLEECPKCGGKLRRIIHGGLGLIFKGTGWYVTDYGKGKNPSAPIKKENDPSKEIANKPNSQDNGVDET